MGTSQTPRPVLLFAGLLSPEADLLEACARTLADTYGPLEFWSDIAPWEFTDYYRDEMGSGLLRQFLFFSGLIDPGALAEVKLRTNRIEEETARSTDAGSKRRINIDPGYVTEAKVVLATTKDFAHRIYIGSGIYAEVALQYRRGRGFLPLEHTYPDFRTESTRRLFERARTLLRTRLGKS
jgi:hypothetical protein